MKDDKQRLEVFYKDQLVGTLVKGKKEKVAFQYSKNWLKSGFSISPFSLPLTDQIFLPVKDYFDGLFGVFADSLPDAWGKLLLRRLLLSHNRNPDDYTVLDRLAIVGNSGMGALTYHPAQEFENENADDNLDDLAEQCEKF